MEQTRWYDKTKEETTALLGTDMKEGLRGEQVAERLARFGYNRLAEKKKAGLFVRFLAQLNDFMILILIAAAGVSFFVSYVEGRMDWTDPLIILSIVLINAGLGLAQENRAEKAIDALKKMSAPTAKTVRAGRLTRVPAEEIVPGDLIVLEAGDLVPADARVLLAFNLQSDESALTGESLPVEKEAGALGSAALAVGDQKNMVFSGCGVVCGRGLAVVVATGMRTEVGRIASLLLAEEGIETPLQKKLADTGKKLGVGVLVICAFIFGMGLLRRIPPFDLFMTSVSLAVAAIPEGLPAIVTIVLAIGVQRMAQKNAVIRKLPAVETLGSATVICSDKTGTLTQNKMTVVAISDGFRTLDQKTDARAAKILTLAALCNDCTVEPDGDGYAVTGDPTEAAIVMATARQGFYKDRLEKENERVAEIPFDARRKRMTTIHRNGADGGFTVITKGAPEMLLERCSHYWADGRAKELTQSDRETIGRANAAMADRALRVIGTAFRAVPALPAKLKSEAVERGLVFTGLLGMMDPPREEVAEAVAVCKKAGIRAVMVTGDHVATAVAVAKKIGMMNPGDKAMTGEELSETSQADLCRNIEQYSVFARVSPEHKMRIVKAYQSKGAVVAMTGDGVNDAPALKAADIGCAMGTGTAVAKGAADMVLMDDRFATIVDAVREGRGIYRNIGKAVHFLLSSNIGEIITIFAAILLGWHAPLLAIHLLWVNLVTDSLPAIALGLDRPEADVMQRRQGTGAKSLFADGLWLKIAVEGGMIGMLALLAFGFGVTLFDLPGSVVIGRTMAFATLSITQLVHAFNMRSEQSIFSIDLFDNYYLVGALVVGVLLQVGVIMVQPVAVVFKVVPLSPASWFVVLVLCLMPVLLVEAEKQLAAFRAAARKTVGAARPLR